MEGTVSRAAGNAQALASGAGSLVQGSALAASKIPRDGLGDNSLGAAGWAQYVLHCKAKQLPYLGAQQASEST